MQVKALIVSLFLAATVSAAPTEKYGYGKGDIETLTSEINDNFKGNDVANGVGKGGIVKDVLNHNVAGNGNGNNNGNGNAIASGNHGTGDNNVLNDSLNFNSGATSRQVSEEVMAAMKSLTLTCIAGNEGAMSCTWKS
ncbi:hypothetical protein SAMD00023353_0900700 [Rosellinia necatrix]|uniref:Uncharacterized protein n=1 Tax=Rosellinia necatrix TaxID=77044 RepID=A0A1W2THJ7_ROSNE|nr:hypothetical protein SAMD00023353_0900700 [Rosellinia necatrix]